MGLKKKTLGQKRLTAVEVEAISFLWLELFGAGFMCKINNLGLMYVF